MTVNSYLIKGEGRFLLIDTGWNRAECMRVMLSELDSLKVDLNKTDFFITHVHPDHLGLVQKIATNTSTIYFNFKETYMINREISETEEERKKVGEVYISNGFPEDELGQYMESHPAQRYGLNHHLDVHILKESDSVQIGDYCFTCIETPGHSLGHICLYEAHRKILVAGDHILFDISPIITFRLAMQDSLTQYLNSLKKVCQLDVNLVLPGHRRIFYDHRNRVKELQKHHRARLREILTILEEEEKSIFQVVPDLTWDIDCTSWERFTPMQKWFAFGETLAHIKHLEEDGLVRAVKKEDKTLFSLI